jgi:hypothetical protein
MTPRRTIVFFPCHSLDDFPTWLGDSEADELLAAWTAAWHPRLIAAAGRMPAWASVEVPPGNDAEVLGIVTASCDDRLVGRLDPASTPGSRWVRRAGDRPTTVRQALAALGLAADPEPAVAPPPSAPTAPADPTQPQPPRQAGVDDFHAFGLAWLLSELLARRMRSSTGLGSTAAFTGGPSDEPATGFEERLVAGARALEAGDATAAAEALAECYGHLEAARARYYPVDVWLIDLVLLADTTLGPRLATELDAPVPLALVATGQLIEKLARTDPALTARLRQACDVGRIAPAGGRYEEEPLDGLFPETIRESFLQGHRAWRQAVGRVPATFAQFGGGWSAILPQILTHFDYAGVIWNLFDGTPLPDPGLGRIRWEGTGSGSLEGIARPPLDARRSSTVLNLADRIGDALDNEHTAVIPFAHYAGMASPWFDDLRRVGAWTTALGTFVTPDEHFRRTPGSGKLVSWEPDSYPVSRPPADAAGTTDSSSTADPIAPRVAAVRSEAQRLVAGRKVLAGLPVTATAGPGPGGKRVIREAGAPDVAPQASPTPVAAARKKPSGGLLGGLARGLFGGGGDDRLVLEHDQIRVRVHPQTGGLLSVRRPEDRGNRLSQHLAMRTTRPAPAVGSPWEDPQERAEYATATAESVTRTDERTILSRGHCSDAKGRKLFTFSQRVELLDGLPLARLDIEVALVAPAPAPGGAAAALERYAACRFAWNENDDLDVVRSLHGQAIVSERTLITAPHFLALRPVHGGGVADVNILTGGLPWHLRASPHILDALLLAGDGVTGKFTLAVGLGLARPWQAALDLIAGGSPALPPSGHPATTADHVRITWQGPVMAGGRPIGVRVGLVESQGKGGDVTVDWGFDVAAARVADALGRPSGSKAVTVAGRSTTTYLRRWEWLQIDLLFPGRDGAGEWPTEERASP